jgi:hypothetical protein
MGAVTNAADARRTINLGQYGLAAYQRREVNDTVRSKSAMGIPVMPPSPFTG